MIGLMTHYKWTEAVVLTSTYVAYFESGLRLADQMQGAGIKVLKPETFEPGRFNSATLIFIKHSGQSIKDLSA